MRTKNSFWEKGFSLTIFVLVGVITFSSCNFKNNPAENIVVNLLFTDNLVLQQKKILPIWGTAKPRGEVSVKFINQHKVATVDNNGNWKIELSPVDAGGPYELIISGEKVITIKNVMVGEVWLCSGQSNMEMPLAGWGKVNNYKKEIANSKYPNIRLLKIEKRMANNPIENIDSDGWKECSPKTIPEFSAVAYFYGRKLYNELKVPIGLIESAWGGTVVEAWTSGGTLKKLPEFTEIVNIINSDSSTEAEKSNKAKKQRNEWPDKIERILQKEGVFDHGFQNIKHNGNNWKTMNLPTLWEDKGLDIDGVVWFSKIVDIPNSWKGKDLILSLGKINDYDITWFNGVRVGRGTDVIDLRKYKIDKSIVKTGQNKIVVEVLDIGNVGGLYGPANQMKLFNGKESISLVGYWNYKVDPIKINVSVLPKKPTSNSGANRPTVLYNAMINPLIPYGIKGAIWYQGESNAERAYQYRKLFKDLISDWRNAWGESDFPFYFVQLANFKKYKALPENASWAELREAQTMALELSNTGMAVTIDIGNSKDIHPKNKQEVGRRLSLIALAKTYDKDITYSGPMYDSMKIIKDKIYIKFKNIDKGLIIKNGKQLKGFAIAGSDKKYLWAEAKIKGDEIIVWNSKIKNPAAVRYAWAANPVCNLYNSSGLPASPFRTDNWKGITFGKK